MQGAKIAADKFADACCYEKDTIEYLEENNIIYYIRTEQSENISIALEDKTE